MLLTQNWAQKPSVLVQVLTARGRGGKISFFRAVKNGREKTPKPLRLRGFPVRYLFWSHNVVAGGGLEPPASGLWERIEGFCRFSYRLQIILYIVFNMPYLCIITQDIVLSLLSLLVAWCKIYVCSPAFVTLSPAPVTPHPRGILPTGAPPPHPRE